MNNIGREDINNTNPNEQQNYYKNYEQKHFNDNFNDNNNIFSPNHRFNFIEHDPLQRHMQNSFENLFRAINSSFLDDEDENFFNIGSIFPFSDMRSSHFNEQIPEFSNQKNNYNNDFNNLSSNQNFNHNLDNSNENNYSPENNIRYSDKKIYDV